MSAVRFSIIIPAYNAAKTIDAAVDSVEAQRFGSWELVIVDDGSTDDTQVVAEERAKTDPRIRIIRQANCGSGAARNAAAKVAVGDYLVFLDADDELDPEYLAAQHEFITSHPGAAIYSVHATVFGEGVEAAPWHPIADRAQPYSLGLDDLLTTNPIYVSACVSAEAFHAVGGFAADRYAEDFDLWVRLLAAGETHWANPRILAHYRVSPGSKSAMRSLELCSVAATLREASHSGNLEDGTRRRLADAAVRAGALARRYGLEERASSGDTTALREIDGTMRSAYGGRFGFLGARVLGAIVPRVYMSVVAGRRKRRRDSGTGGHTRSQFGVNVRANALLLALQTGMGLWFAPYLINNLGVAVYGLLPLANSVASYMSVLEFSVRGSLSRELSRAFATGGSGERNVVFNTAFWASVALAFALSPLALAVSMSAPQLFSVPEGYDGAARILFGVILLMYLVGMVRSILTTVPFTRNRFDLQNVTPMSEIVVRVVVVVAMFSLSQPRIEWVALSLVVSGALATVVALRLNRRIATDLRLDIRAFDISLLKRMWETSSWMMVNQVGTLLFLSIDVVVVNVMLGAEASGRYGSLLIWSVFLRSLAGAVSSAVTPVALRKHALGEHEGLARVMGESIGLLGIAIALPVGALCGFAAPVLTVWLGPDFAALDVLLIAQVFHLSLNLAVLPLFSVQLAAGRVRIPGIVTLIGGLANVALAISLASLGRNGLGVALAGALILTLKNALFTTAYTAHIQGTSWRPYVLALLRGVLVAVAVFVASRASLELNVPQGWIGLGAQGIVVVGVCAAVVYSLVLTRGQRHVVHSLIGVKSS